jgi:predicted O-methyltransferase YrrM
MPEDDTAMTELLRLLQTPQINAEIARESEDSVIRALFGRWDSFDVDKLAWLAAGIDSAQYATEHMSEAQRCGNNFELLSCALAAVALPGLFLEFGVYSGSTIAHIAALRPHDTIYGFDSFEGLPESWREGFPKGRFALAESELPVVCSNVELIKGWFDRTLPSFCAAHAGKQAAFIHIDCDLYSSTQTILAQLKPCIAPGTIIVFDEYFNYPGWQKHEYRAFREFCGSSNTVYRYIGLVPHNQQVAVRVVAV